MSILISGVGRSGASVIYQVLGKGYVDKFSNARCVYEPYLWKLSPALEDNEQMPYKPFSAEQIDLFNLNVHCHTPLFFSDRDRLHDYWLRKTYGSTSIKINQTSTHTIAKVIRGAGRLDSALSLFEDLKVVIVVRNVIDTVNSGLGLLSFFGDEFHPSDKKRFIKEVNKKFLKNFNANNINSELEWSTLWWYYFTKASFDTYEKYRDRVLLVPYELYKNNQLVVMQEIFDFAGVERKFINKSLIYKETGPTTSISYMTNSERNKLKTKMDWYFSRLNELNEKKVNGITYQTDLNEKFKRRRYIKSFLELMPTNMSAIQWRIQARDNALKTAKNNFQITEPFCVSSTLAKFGNDIENVANLSKKQLPILSKKCIGVVITCYNNESSIAASIYSVLAQTRKVDVICVADDCSTDNSVKIIENLIIKFPFIKLIKRLANVGVAANRDLAIRALDADYITTLDGDDLYAPHKIESEELALKGSTMGIAFSDIVVVSPKSTVLQVTAPYHKQATESLLDMLLSRSSPVPRDLMFCKDLFIKSEGFDVGMHLYEDWALKMRLFAIANQNEIVHTNCKGTIYDRREPGLSNKKWIDHSYAQLQAIARNANLFQHNIKALTGGLNTVSRPFDKGLLQLSTAYINSIGNGIMLNQVIDKLNLFWATCQYRDNAETKKNRLINFFTK